MPCREARHGQALRGETRAARGGYVEFTISLYRGSAFNAQLTNGERGKIHARIHVRRSHLDHLESGQYK